jgi:hypothetical protein
MHLQGFSFSDLMYQVTAGGFRKQDCAPFEG